MRVVKIFIPLLIVISFFPAAASADCFDECMSIKNCWHKGQTYSSYCGSAEVNCETECRNKEAAANRKSYGAIAYSAKDGSYGYSENQQNRRDAEKVALDYCSQHSDKCRVMVWYYNSCGAVAADGRKVGWGHADNDYDAQQKALKSCRKKNCQVQVSRCSF